MTGRVFYLSKTYSIHRIVDRIGAGDAFAGGLIYGLNHNHDSQRALEFATAAACLKHSIPGDINRVSAETVEELMAGEENARIRR
ncbi:MAG: PfkB family carbohydrate kinase [Dysosmobacter sp.]